MIKDYKQAYQDCLICPFIITSSEGKILCKNIAAEKILPFVRKGVHILRYISGEPYNHHKYAGNQMIIIKLMANAEYSGVHKALVIPYTPCEEGPELSLLLFKSTSVMFSSESSYVKNNLLSRVLPVLKSSICDIMNTADEGSVKEIKRFVRNNCMRIYQMDNILSEFFLHMSIQKIPFRGIYEVRSMLLELREYVSDYSTYLGYRISYNIEDNPFLIYAEPQHFFILLIYAYSIICRYTADGKINASYKCASGQSYAIINISTIYESIHEHNRFDHTLTGPDLCVAGFFAEVCGCVVKKKLENGFFELEIQLTQSDKIKGLHKSNPDMMYHCKNNETI